MITLSLPFVLALAPQGPPPALVVINEFLHDEVGTDRREFVELYNRSAGPLDISGWRLTSATAAGPVAAFTIPSTPTRTVLVPGGRWTIGADAALPGGIDQVVGTTDLLDDDTASLTLWDATSTIVDTLVYESVRGIWDGTVVEGAGIRTKFASPAGAFLSWQRSPDGADTDNNGRDFHVMRATPGAPNYTRNNLPFVSVFDSAWGTIDTRFIGSRQSLSTIIPGLIGPWIGGQPLNPNVILASPTGGNCGVVCSPAGDGDTVWLDTAVADDVRIQACVYVDAGRAAPGAWESWVMGVRGVGGSHAEPPDPSGTLWAYTGRSWEPGYTGVAAVWQRTSATNDLWLVDFGDGSTMRVLGRIPIQAGQNGGWRMFTLGVAGTTAALRWGDQQVSGSLSSDSSGGVYVSYRGDGPDRSQQRPATFDDMTILKPSPRVRPWGSSTPNSHSQLRADFSAPPSIGTQRDVFGIGVLPGPVGFATGVRRPQPLALGAGFPPGAELYIEIVDMPVVVADSTAVFYPLLLPNDPLLVGAQVSFQLLQLDPALPDAIPLSMSQGLEVVLGR